MGQKRRQNKDQLGKLPPQHNFFLNPYTDTRFTHCPQCDDKTKLRKKPLLIVLDRKQPVSLNKSCRYCPQCDLLIVHKDELDNLVEAMAAQHFPDVSSQDYFVVGTMERKAWKEGNAGQGGLFDAVHDFKEHVEFEPARYVWVKDE